MKSRIENFSKEELEEITKNSKTLTEILKHVGLKHIGGNHKTIKKHLSRLNIDFSHIPLGINHQKLRGQNGFPPPNKRSLESILVKDSDYKSSILRKRLIRADLLENKCLECGQESIWNGKELILQLDHINGEHTDNRLENLRILCPNCHTQTNNYAGRSVKAHKEDQRKTKEARERSKQLLSNLRAEGKIRSGVANKPDKDTLSKLL